MKKKSNPTIKIFSLIILFAFANISLFAQSKPAPAQDDFWKNVRFGGGLTLNFGSGFTNIGVSPTAIYNVNEYFSIGPSLQFSYVSAKNLYNSTILGGSIIALANPLEQIQLSAELEQLNVSTTYENNLFPKQNFWNTGLWLGAGYRTNNITIGGRYNVLFDKNKSVYSEAFMPFVRVFF